MAQNPLQIDLVLQHVAKFLNNKELRACRKLNGQWKDAMDKEFRKRCVMLQVTSLDPCENGWKHQVTMKRLLELAGNLEDTDPLANLFKRYQNIMIRDSEEMPLLPYWNNFLSSYGQQLTKLGIRSIDLLDSVENFVAILSCKFTPSLEELSFLLRKQIKDPAPVMSGLSEKLAITAKVNKNLRKLELETYGSNSINAIIEHIPWLQIFSLYPNIKLLSMYGWPHAVFKKVVMAIGKIRNEDKNQCNLTKLYLYGGEPQSASWKTTETGMKHCKQVLKLLLEANLQLQVITMDDSAGFYCMEFANNQHNSIKVLEMQTEMTNQTFQMMPNLEQLTIVETLNLSFLDKAPNLISLQIGKPHNNTLPLLWPSNCNTPPITSLTVIKSNSVVWQSSELHKLFRYMPNISELEMRLNDETLLCVYEHLVKLKQLTVLGQAVTDEGIVGLENLEDGDVESFNITNLQELEVFNLVGLLTNRGLTARSISCGFVKLDKLSRAILILKAGVDHDVVKSLYDKVPSVIIFENCGD